jgi:hypothetical protein
MDDVGDVGGGAAGGKIGGGAQVDHLIRGGHRIGRDAGARHHHLGLRVEHQPRQHLLVADAATRILVHDLDQLSDGVHAIAHHVPGRAARGRDQFAVHHQQAVVVALQVGLNDHRARDARPC